MRMAMRITPYAFACEKCEQRGAYLYLSHLFVCFLGRGIGIDIRYYSIVNLSGELFFTFPAREMVWIWNSNPPELVGIQEKL